MVNDYASDDAKKMMGNVRPEEVFNLNNGSSIKNIKELYSALQSMEDDTFSHHVNSERNDFSNWVRDIHKDYKLANSLSSARSREECAKAVASRMYEVQKSAEKKKNEKLEEKKAAITAVAVVKPEVKVPAKLPEKSPEKVSEKTVVKTPLVEKKEKPKTQKDSRFSDTETAAERLEKILNDAVKAKMEKIKTASKEKKKESGHSKVIDIDAGKVFRLDPPKSRPRIRNEPFTLKRKENAVAKTEKTSGNEEKNVISSPSAIDAKVNEKPIEDLFTDMPQQSDAPDSCEEMISFAEDKSMPKKVLSEVSSIFAKSSSKAVKDDVKKTLIAGPSSSDDEEDDGGDLPDDTEEERIDLKENMAVKADTKEKMLSYLKRLYK